MNKHTFRGMVAGLLAGLCIAGGTVYAVNTSTLYDVLVGGVRIVIDGKEFTPINADGEVVQPMIYKGTTYLPVRAVSGAFGKAVYWDDEEKTVYLGNMEGKLKQPTAKFFDLKNIAGASDRIRTEKNVFDNYNNFYNSAFYCQFYEDDCIEFLLDGQYSKFKATLFVKNGTDWKDDYRNSFTVIGDEKVIYKSPELGKTSKPVNIEFDVSNVNDFKIIFSDYGGMRIANAGFYQ